MSWNEKRVAAMAAEYSRYLDQLVSRVRAGMVIGADGIPDTTRAATTELQQSIIALSPDATRYLLTAAVIRLVAADIALGRPDA